MPDAQLPLAQGTLLAFDFGEKRVGVAVGNNIAATAQPLTTIAEEQTEARFAAIAALLAEWRPVALIVGLPCYQDGAPHALTGLCRRFANRLYGRYRLPVLLIDERYTSAAASETLNARGIRGYQQKALLDQEAALHILQAYLADPSSAVLNCPTSQPMAGNARAIS